MKANFFKKVIVMSVALLLISIPVMALDIHLGEDVWLSNMYDRRTYDSSHPGSGVVSTYGGWQLGLNFHEPLEGPSNPKFAQIGAVHIIADGYTHVQTEPDVYPWIDSMMIDYTVWIGHKFNLAETFEIKVFDTTGDPVNFIDFDGITPMGTSLFLSPSTTAPMPPICQIKTMKVKNNGDILLIFTAPYKNNLSRHIRIRVFTADNAGAEVQFRYDPPFEYSRADGSTVGDTVKAIIPGEYSGRRARIEYRLPEEENVDPLTGSYLTRGIKWLTLP